MSFNKESGVYEGYIYLIRNNINGKGYIGLTTQTIQQRFLSHIHNNDTILIDKKINEYGAENFTVIEIEKIEHDDKELLIEILEEKEIYYIELYKTLVTENGYNVSRGGNIATNKYKAVSQFDYDGNLINKYSSVQEAAMLVGVPKSCISRCCTNTDPNRITAGGFLWCFEGAMPEINKKHRNRHIDEYDFEGNLVAVHDSLKAITSDKKEQDSLYNCLNGYNIQWNGSIWRYHGEPFDKYRTEFKNGLKKSVVCILNGRIIGTYSSGVEAAKETNCHPSHVSACCRGERKRTKGLEFKFLSDIKNTNIDGG